MKNLSDLISPNLKKRELAIQVDDKGTTNEYSVWLRTLPLQYVYPYTDDSGEEVTGLRLTAKRISHCVVNEDGNPIFDEDHVLGVSKSAIPPLIVDALNDLIIEENGLGKIYQSLLEKMNSGASSSSTESADEQ